MIPALRVALHKATARFNGRPAKNMQLENAQRFTQHVNIEIHHSKKVGKFPIGSQWWFIMVSFMFIFHYHLHRFRKKHTCYPNRRFMVTKLTNGDPWPGVTMVAIEVYLKLQGWEAKGPPSHNYSCQGESWNANTPNKTTTHPGSPRYKAVTQIT